MLARIRKAQEEREGGFTLIELLVVVIIIGILAAIAIPVFLNQRKKGYDAHATSDLKNAATSEEAYLTGNPNGSYGNTLASLTSSGYSPSTDVSLWVAVNSNSGFCLVTTSVHGSGNFYTYDSGAGGVQSTVSTTAAGAEGVCSATTIGASPTWTSLRTGS
jgi:type IV pilus assembly protein PilA